MSELQYVKPKREILSPFHIMQFTKSAAYIEYLAFLKRINRSVRRLETHAQLNISLAAQSVIQMLDFLENVIAEYPPEDLDVQRFGNKAYRKWYNRMFSELENLLSKMLPPNLTPASIELISYLQDSFGNSTRIDYGSGHEASFLIFLYCLYKIGFLKLPDDDKVIVLKVFHRYLKLVRCLQSTYRMEPAGSRGVYALDDFQFCPFIFGSSQLIGNKPGLIPDNYLRPEMVKQYKNDNLFFEAIDCINETKTGFFYEHSNQLYNISVIKSWEKVNEGLFKMYEAEVLKKYPIVQHFVFGSIFSFETLPESSKPPKLEDLNENDNLKEVSLSSNLKPIPE